MNKRPAGGGNLAPWVVLVSIGLAGWATCGDEPAGYWAPEGFVDRANELIARGGLELHCAAQDSIPEQDSIALRVSPDSPDERFFHASYLRTDVRRFNADPSAARLPFLVDGCSLLGVDPFYHRVDLPFNRVPRWTGPVYFARSSLSTLLIGGREQRLQLLHPLEGLDATTNQRVNPTDRGANVRTAFLRFEEATRGTEISAEAFFVGRDAVLANRLDVGSLSVVRVNGFALPPGRMVGLQSGDWIQFQHPSPRTNRGNVSLNGGAAVETFTYLAEGPERAGMISPELRGEGASRRYLVPHMAPFVRLMSQALEGGLQSTPSARDGGAVSRMEIQLALDQELENASQEVVERWCRDRRLPDRPRAVSALIMDAFNGDVLAMPSCPGESLLDEYQLPTRVRSRLLRNQNLLRHPAGSSMKPFWAAAIATAYPGLLDLELPAHTDGRIPVQDVLGCRLSGTGTYSSRGHQEWEGVETFIQTSCNRYMVELATIALLAGGGSQSCSGEGVDIAQCLAALPAGRGAESRPVRFCDRVVELVLSDGLPFTGETCDDLRLIGDNFAPGPNLADLTGAAVYRDAAPSGMSIVSLDEAYRVGHYRLDLWRDPIEQLRAAGDTAAHVNTQLRFSAVSPEVTNLALNTVEDLRADWVSLLLGGENSRWSNFQLAEAVSRLMTGRNVRGRIVTGADTPNPLNQTFPGQRLSADRAEPAAEVLPEETLHPGARRRVLHAMELVARPGGTAARLAPAVQRLQEAVRDTVRTVRGAEEAEEWEVRVFAKTGTPGVPVPLPDGLANREGSVLVLGVLVVPPEANGTASQMRGDWISACPLSPGLEAAILGVPPADFLEGERDRVMGFGAAYYLDDTDPEGETPASQLAVDLMEPLEAYIAQRLKRQLRREDF